MIRAVIAGVGKYNPDKVLTNQDLEKMVETSDEWITERTGIRERRICEADMYTSCIATKAAERAIENAEISPEEIELIIVGTVTPEFLTPSVSCLVQKNIGAVNAACFDLNAACSGFVYSMDVADTYIRSGKYKTILIIGADCLITRTVIPVFCSATVPALPFCGRRNQNGALLHPIFLRTAAWDIF